MKLTKRNVRDDGDRVADEQRATALRAASPMQRRAAIEVPAALTDRDAGDELARALPPDDPLVGILHVLAIR